MEKKKICVMGLGYIGLPTAVMFATHGHKIVGVDVNEAVIEALNDARIIIKEPYLDLLVHGAVISGNLKAQTMPEEADVFIIAVPTPIQHDKTADMSFVTAATRAIIPYLRAGNVVILESTSPTGTVNDLMLPILAESGLVIGEQLMVAHAPERVLPGRILIELVENNRIVGGVNLKSAEAVRDLYKTFVKGEIYLTDATTAEMCKMTENTYRDVNIAFANELAIICEKAGVNAWDVIRLCNKHPRVSIHQPGPGVGGHCIAVDPWFIIEKYPDEAQIIALARRTNDAMPGYLADKIEVILNNIPGKKKIAVLGITYKPDVEDIRESPVIHLIELLKNHQDYEISMVDPYVRSGEYKTDELLPAVKGSDLVILGVNHKEFAAIDFAAVGDVMRNKNLLDTRNFLKGDDLTKLGFHYYLLGRDH